MDFTFKRISIKAKVLWIDTETLKEMDKRENLYNLSRANRITPDEREQRRQAYKTQKNKVTKLIRMKRADFINRNIRESMNDCKKMWQIMKQVIGKSKKTTNDDIPESIEGNDNCIVNEPQQVLNALNDHFVNVGIRINEESRQKHQNQERTHTASRTIISSIYLYNTNHMELLRIIKTLKTEAAAGIDGITAKILKKIARELSYKLIEPINECMREGHFPETFKETRVKALYKGKGSRKNRSNYRPISVLSNMSKIFEKLLYQRIYSFFEKHDVISPTQFGFLPQSNTTSAVLHAVSKIKSSIDEKKLTAAIFIDIAKAFDSIDHGTILKKLFQLGIRGKSNELLREYLFNRRQITSHGKVHSDPAIVKSGIPQGSNLSSLLFLTYINDCLTVELKGYIQMYADDSILIYSCEDITQLHAFIQADLQTIDQWMYNNYMSFNGDKTKMMIFTTQGQPTPHISIDINNTTIEQVSQIRYLGLIIDEKLSFKQHTQYLINKITPYIFILRRTRYTLPARTKLMLYYSHVHSQLTYLISIWGFSNATNLNALQIIQNKAVRSLFWPEYKRNEMNTNQLLQKYKILTIEQLKISDSLLLIKKLKTNMIKNEITLKTFENVHGYNTRNKGNFIIPKSRLNILHNSLLVKGLTLYNSLPQRLKNETDFQRFKRSVKSHLTNTL